MARIARVVAPEIPHHITQRGNRPQETFFCAEDYQAYPTLLREWCGHWKVEARAYCLMSNHAHVIAVPTSEDALRRADKCYHIVDIKRCHPIVDRSTALQTSAARR